MSNTTPSSKLEHWSSLKWGDAVSPKNVVPKNIAKLVATFNASALKCPNFTWKQYNPIDEYGLKTPYKGAFCTLLNDKCVFSKCPKLFPNVSEVQK